MQGQSPNYRFSAGWFARFKTRYNLRNIRLHGEAASADREAVDSFRENLKKLIIDEGYSPKQVYNADESGLFWKKMPSRTFVSQEENKAAGFKVQKDRLTLLFAGNAYGDVKLKPMLVYRSKNPRALKNCDKEALPVIWRHNKKAWITRREFTDWFSNHFVPFIETYNKDQNLDNKAMLILDNASVHPVELGQLYLHIKNVFLPPNTTSLIQPLDQGIIANFKVFYLRSTLEKLAFAIAENNEDIRSHWKIQYQNGCGYHI